MDCTEFEGMLDDFLSGELAADKRFSATAHLSTCPDCRQLTSVARGDLDRTPVGSESSLAASILAKTGTDPCKKARSQLCDLVDGVLSPSASKILASHLEHCGRCSALFVALTEVATLLPEFAEIQPDNTFLRDTLAFTKAPTEEIMRPPSMLRTLADRLFQRPRFSWEAAYVGTLIMVTLLGGAPDWPNSTRANTAWASLKIDTGLVEQMVGGTPREWFLKASVRARDRISEGQLGLKKQIEDSVLYMEGELDRIVDFSSGLYERGRRYWLSVSIRDLAAIPDTMATDEISEDHSSEE